MNTDTDSIAPSYLATPVVQYLGDILQELKDGELLVPRFQRDFIWKPDQQLELLRSIYAGIPIGSIMVWRTSSHKLKTESRVGFHIFPDPSAGAKSTRSYLLDGLQRLCTLLIALVPHHPNLPPLQKPGVKSELPFGDDYQFFYDLRQEDFVILRKGSPPQYLVPTTILLSSLQLLRFQRNLESLLDSEQLIARCDRLANAFRNYKLPIIPIVSNDLEDATKAFQRINSGGTPMSDTHMVAALTFGKDFDLALLLDNAADRLAGVGWQKLDRKYILATVRALRNLEIANPNAEQLSKALRADHGLVERAVDCIIRAASFLRERCVIPTPDFVPYSYQAVLIAAALEHTPTLTNVQSDALYRWLWRTTYTALFLGARSQNINDALEKVRRIVAMGDADVVPSDDLVETLPSRFDFRAARSKALAARLAELEPRTFDGKVVDVRKLFEASGAAAIGQLLEPRRAVENTGPENRFIYPPNIWPVDKVFALVDDSISQEVFRSQAIPESAVPLWRSHKFADFFVQRRECILELEGEFVTGLGLRYSIL